MTEPHNPRTLYTIVITLSLLGFVAATAQAQQPFVTDDADVTPKGRFHFEFSNQFDLLQRGSFPNLKQNTASFELAYGLWEGVEISIESPLITIINDRNPRLGNPTKIRTRRRFTLSSTK